MTSTETHRRGQARGAASRARIVDAATTCVDRGGYASATTAAIAREAGLSVGALQHHFPSKEDVLAAVLAESAARFAACFDDASVPASDLADRVHDFIARAWRHYGSAFFRAAQEIVIGARRAGGGPLPGMVGSARVAEKVWSARFGDLGLSPAVHRDLRRAAFASLTGLALLSRFESQPARLGRVLAHVETGLLASIEAAVAERTASAG